MSGLLLQVLTTASDVLVRRLLMHYCPRMQRASETHNREPCLVLGLARVYDALNEADKSVTSFKRVLSLDSSNVEAIACLASHYFYTDQVGPCRSSPLHAAHLFSEFRGAIHACHSLTNEANICLLTGSS